MQILSSNYFECILWKICQLCFMHMHSKQPLMVMRMYSHSFHLNNRLDSYISADNITIIIMNGQYSWKQVYRYLVEQQLSPLLLAEVHLFHGDLPARVFVCCDAHYAGRSFTNLDEVVETLSGIAWRDDHLQCCSELWSIWYNVRFTLRKTHKIFKVASLDYQKISKCSV